MHWVGNVMNPRDVPHTHILLLQFLNAVFFAIQVLILSYSLSQYPFFHYHRNPRFEQGLESCVHWRHIHAVNGDIFQRFFEYFFCSFSLCSRLIFHIHEQRFRIHTHAYIHPKRRSRANTKVDTETPGQKHFLVLSHPLAWCMKRKMHRYNWADAYWADITESLSLTIHLAPAAIDRASERYPSKWKRHWRRVNTNFFVDQTGQSIQRNVRKRESTGRTKKTVAESAAETPSGSANVQRWA